ncbi:MAG: endolytic transglycosylase MltG [Alphaproteobacteria bacterium]|nr:endolytic transglycosylase MltG [Alphaproteobacteria bacterium]
MRFLGFVAVLFIAAAGVVAAGFFWLQAELYRPGPSNEEKLVLIKPGSSGRQIAQRLVDEGVITTPLAFRIAARVQPGGHFKAGEFAIPAQANLNDVMAQLRDGKVYQRNVTFAEGLTSLEIVETLNAAEGMTGTVEAIPAEGSLLPETYSFTREEPRAKIIARMQESMQKTVAELWEARAEGLPVKTPEEAVILASIVEKETGVAEERARVAGVFINRLKKGMPLQSDPTVIYALTDGKKKFERKLYRKDLKFESPYNTYTIPGLPPGPIANPGRAAIAAVLQPEEHGFYYFVADGTGGHIFAESYDKHKQNVINWWKFKKSQKGKEG